MKKASRSELLVLHGFEFLDVLQDLEYGVNVVWTQIEGISRSCRQSVCT